MDPAGPARFPSDRLGSGDPGLDRVLSGGLLRSSVILVQGAPGAGKTVLANQIAFGHARNGGKTVYLTLLAESHARLTAYMGQLDFFRADEVSRSVHYLSGYSVLVDEGVKGILRLIGRELKAHGASMLVIDGLFTLEETVEEDTAFRKFISDLGMYAELMDCTVLLLTNGKRLPTSPEFTMVDAWVEVGRLSVDYRTQRYVEVHKLRGSAFLSGRHTARISEHGFTVYPRIETVMGQSPAPACSAGRLDSGIDGLDDLIGGGIGERSSTLISGPTGVGKTTVGLHFLSGASKDAPGLLFGLHEDAPRLLSKADAFGIGLRRMVDDGTVHVAWHPPTEHALDELGHRLIGLVRERGIRRLVVDSINAWRQTTAHPDRFGRYLAALTHELRLNGCTSLLMLETPGLVSVNQKMDFTSVSSLAENLITLRYAMNGPTLARALAVVKLRDQPFDPRVHSFTIGHGGIRVGAVYSPQPASTAPPWTSEGDEPE